MEHAFLVIVSISVFGFILLFLMISSPRSDQTYSRKLARIRVPTNDRHRRSLPPDDDLDNQSFTEVMLLAAVLLLLLMFINAAS